LATAFLAASATQGQAAGALLCLVCPCIDAPHGSDNRLGIDLVIEPSISMRSLDLPASGWGCDGCRVDHTGCWPGLEMVLVGSLGRDSCFGDSGGPLYELVGNGARCDWRLVAITSRSIGSGHEACGSGGLSTRADALDTWIDQTLASWKHAPP
jgi:hypothetical protein